MTQMTQTKQDKTDRQPAMLPCLSTNKLAWSLQRRRAEALKNFQLAEGNSRTLLSVNAAIFRRFQVALGTLKFAPSVGELAPGSDEFAPGGCQFAPSIRELAPGSDEFAPGGCHFAPSVGELAPGSDELAPGSDEFAPSCGELACSEAHSRWMPGALHMSHPSASFSFLLRVDRAVACFLEFSPLPSW